MLGYRERAGLLLLQLFPNGGATDIVFVTLFCIVVGTAIAWCCGRCAVPDGYYFNILCSGGGPRQPWSSGMAPVSRFQSSVPVCLSSPSLIGLLASVDVKQQKSICTARVSTCIYRKGVMCTDRISAYTGRVSCVQTGLAHIQEGCHVYRPD